MKKRHCIMKTAIGFVVLLGVFRVVPANDTLADWKEWNQNSNDTIDRDDVELMLKSLLNGRWRYEYEPVDMCLDFNKDGEASVEDVYLYKAGNYKADNYEAGLQGQSKKVLEAEMVQEVSEDFIQVEVCFKDGVEIQDGYFDYAVLYDKDKMQVEGIQWSEEFEDCFPKESYAYVAEDKEDYIALAGCLTESIEAMETRTLATITFSYRNDDRQQGNIDFVTNASRYNNSIQGLRRHGNHAIQLYGDTDGDGNVTIQDALQVLQVVLRRGLYSDYDSYSADYNDDGRIDLFDVQNTLKTALKIQSHSLEDIRCSSFTEPCCIIYITEERQEIVDNIQLGSAKALTVNGMDLSIRDAIAAYDNMKHPIVHAATIDIGSGMYYIGQNSLQEKGKIVTVSKVNPQCIRIGLEQNWSVIAKDLIAKVRVHTNNIDDIDYQIICDGEYGYDVSMYVQEKNPLDDGKIYYMTVIYCADIYSTGQHEVPPNISDIRLVIDVEKVN